MMNINNEENDLQIGKSFGKHKSWSFHSTWLLWIVGTVLGAIIGINIIDTSDKSMFGVLVSLLVCCTVVGFFQSFVLWLNIKSLTNHQWLVIAWSLSMIIAWLPSFFVGYLIALISIFLDKADSTAVLVGKIGEIAVGMLVLSIAQQWILRKWVLSTVKWIPENLLGWIIGWIMVLTVDFLIPGIDDLKLLAGIITGFAILGIVTGRAMARILVSSQERGS